MPAIVGQFWVCMLCQGSGVVRVRGQWMSGAVNKMFVRCWQWPHSLGLQPGLGRGQCHSVNAICSNSPELHQIGRRHASGPESDTSLWTVWQLLPQRVGTGNSEYPQGSVAGRSTAVGPCVAVGLESLLRSSSSSMNVTCVTILHTERVALQLQRHSKHVPVLTHVCW